ncbi:unnamed protein product [Ceutorhynchus assimilis]|uniref:Uncharacterized protein n=1 Tax=Ceutorhynchus assimilis TaxID=467358 RepID=A0A9N9MUT8_9CUCU|nr:unnamed protein product [Ceutorhynchus assimilis]
MQNPKVWSFHEPQSSFKVQQLLATDISIKNFQNFHFSHLISVFVPDSLSIPENLPTKLIEDCEYYKVAKLNLADLVEAVFLNSFIKKGKLSLLSIGTKIDADNCCAVTPDGNLILSLLKDTYQSCGLEGKVSHFTKTNKDRYIVTVNLAELKPGKPLHGKTQKSLEALGKFDVILSWQPYDDIICPSSVAKYFQNYDIKLCEPTFDSHMVYSVKGPTLDSVANQDDIIDFVEWLGMVSLDADFSGNMENYVNTYESPEPNVEMGQVRVLTWRGFYSSNQVMEVFDYLRNYNNVQNKLWISMYVQGFSDSPVIEGKEEQNYFTNGDNCNVYILKELQCWFCKHRTCAKRYK